MAQPPDFRVSDDDRERAAAEIREHYARGRLDADELSDRLGRGYGARTAGELRSLRADLPQLPPSPTARRAELAVRACRAEPRARAADRRRARALPRVHGALARVGGERRLLARLGRAHSADPPGA